MLENLGQKLHTTFNSTNLNTHFQEAKQALWNATGRALTALKETRQSLSDKFHDLSSSRAGTTSIHSRDTTEARTPLADQLNGKIGNLKAKLESRNAHESVSELAMSTKLLLKEVKGYTNADQLLAKLQTATDLIDRAQSDDDCSAVALQLQEAIDQIATDKLVKAEWTAKQLEDLDTQIQDLQSIQFALGVMVDAQGPLCDNIEMAVESAATHTEKGTVQLEKATTKAKSNRKLKAAIGIALGVAGSAIALTGLITGLSV